MTVIRLDSVSKKVGIKVLSLALGFLSSALMSYTLRKSLSYGAKGGRTVFRDDIQENERRTKGT